MSEVVIKSIEELEKMHTGTLMSRRNALLKCKELSTLPSNRADSEKMGVIEYKNTPVWTKAYTDLKAVLSSRENLLNKAERKAMRQAKAKQSR